MKMEEKGWSPPAAIGRVVGKLRFYLGNGSDSGKFKGTMKMLDLLEEKLKLLQDENLQRVCIDREEEMDAWLQQVKEAADDEEELVKDMETGESAIPYVMTWFCSDSSNLLRMKYTIGRLVSVCSEGESLLGIANLDEDVRESKWIDGASLTPDHAYVVGRDEEIAMILNMIMDDAHFMAATSLESYASAEGLQRSQQGWIIETVRNISLSQQRQEDEEVASYQKEMGASVEYTQVCNNTATAMMNPMVIPMVGINGVGKTTLAQFIFNDRRVQEHFHGQSAWVYFTDNIRKEELMTEILVALKQHKILADVFDLNSLHDELQNFIKGKRFLLVLDDVSDEICAIWNDLRGVLSKGAPGSVILVTTQIIGVARFMGTTTPIFLYPLQRDDLWNVLKHHAFASNQSTETLEAIGRKIADKLHGFPLAATMIGLSLRRYLDEVHWDKLLRSWWWNISSNSFGIHIVASLGVCYCELPAYLRQCLVFCAVFPRNYVFGKYELSQMWIANGFIELNNPAGSQSLDEVAAGWFDELANRCFLQPTIWKDLYIMHDLVRDFAIALSSNEYCGVGCKLPDLPPNARHLSIDMDSMNVLWADYNIKKLRSLMLFGGFCDTIISEGFDTVNLLERSHGAVGCISEISYDPAASISEIFSDTFDSISEISDTIDSISEWSSDTYDNLLWKTDTIDVDHADIILKRSCETIGNILTAATSLRLLDLSNMRLSAAEACVGDSLLDEDQNAVFVKFVTRHQMLPHLTHLRYLDFSYSGITELPDSLCSLCNLQVLGLRGCRFKQLPRSMNSLISLRHLHADADTIALIYCIGKLTKLQELHEYRVADEDGHRITELRGMRYIQGPLCISDLQKVADESEATEANLLEKEFITCLDLKWVRNQSPRGKYKWYGKKLKQHGGDQEDPLHASLLEKNYTPSDISGSTINPSEVATPDVAMKILECLSPPRYLQKLKNFGYPGYVFPDWVEQLHYIQVIEISHCTELRVLPPLGQLKHLRKLKLHELPSIKDACSNLYGTSNVVFRSLEELTFESMVNWENWADAGDRELFPKLQNLKINRCYILKELPTMALGVAIKVLTLSGCGSFSGKVSSYLQRLNFLTHLKVHDCSQKLIVPCQYLVSLEYLHLSDCMELCFEGGIFCLNNLKKLHISSCHIITSSLQEEIGHLLSGWALRFGEEKALVLKATILHLVKESGIKGKEVLLPDSSAAGLTKELDRKGGEISPRASLSELHGSTITGESPQKDECIPVSQSLTELTMDNLSQSLDLDNILCKLSALRTLCLYKVRKITVLHEQWLQKIKSLQELEFSCCYFLRKLPSNLSSLLSLKKLSLQSCSRIHSLPSKGLPGNLKELQILGCSPILEARCQKETGETWVKKKIGEWPKGTIIERQQEKLHNFWKEWLKCEEEWIQRDADDLRNKMELLKKEEDWLKNSAVELESNEDVLDAMGEDRFIKKMGEDWPKIAHIPYIRVNSDIVQNLYH